MYNTLLYLVRKLINLLKKTAMEIAQEILNQLGRGSLYMIGAKLPMAFENGVQFKIMKNDRKIQSIRIELNANDLYDITFSAIKGLNYIEIAKEEGVYAEDMKNVIEKTTGLALRI